MGADFFVRLKRLIKFEDTASDVLHAPFKNGFGNLMQNALYNDSPILPKIEKALDISLDFLFIPNLYNYNTDESDIEFAPEDIKDILREQLKTEKVKSQASWVNIKDFVFELKGLLKAIENNPKYCLNIDYDREYWMNYLDNDDFKTDIKSLMFFLEYLLENNHELFTFDIE